MKYLVFPLIIICFCCFLIPTKVFAQTITELRPFTYGDMVITRNNTVYSMQINLDGTIGATDDEFIPIGGQDSARFLFQDFPALTNLNLSFLPAPLLGPGSTNFNVTAFQTPAFTITDVSGNITINVGSTLNTSGDGYGYTDGDYEGDVTLTVTY